MQIVRLRATRVKKSVGRRENLTFNTFSDLKPAERFQNRCDMSEFRSLGDSTSKRFLNLLKPKYLIVRKNVV